MARQTGLTLRRPHGRPGLRLALVGYGAPTGLVWLTLALLGYGVLAGLVEAGFGS